MTRLFFTVIISAIVIFNTDLFFRQVLLPGIKVTGTRDTPYGNITTGTYSGVESKFYNQRLLEYNDDVIEREEDIHYALLQHKYPEKIIVVAGSLESHLQEILKYPVKKILYIERDPALAESAESIQFPGRVTLEVKNKDAFRYLMTSDEKADAIIMLLPPPTTFSLSRYYSTEFFSKVRDILADGGVFMCSPGQADTYLNEESLRLYSSIFNTLTGNFKNVSPVYGNKLYFIASDADLSVSFCSLAEEKNIVNTYVSRDFLSDDLIERKSRDIRLSLDQDIRSNSLEYPVASMHSQSYYLSRTLSEKIPALILMVIAFAGPLIFVRKRNMIMYFSASALAGLEIVILLLLQLSAGNMYQFTGLILAVVMAGLAAGAGLDFVALKKVKLMIKSIVLAVYYLMLSFLINLLMEVRSIPAAILFLVLLIFPPSFITGNIFSELNEHHPDGSVSSHVYSSDLAGSALGFILVSCVVIPAMGLKASVILLSGFILTGILFGSGGSK